MRALKCVNIFQIFLDSEAIFWGVPLKSIEIYISAATLSDCFFRLVFLAPLLGGLTIESLSFPQYPEKYSKDQLHDMDLAYCG